MADIELRNVTKRYADGTRAVKDLNLEIRDGEFMILVGPSGCGKTTALRMVAGLEGISGGEVRVGGEVVNDRPPRDRDVAMVFQNYALYPHMTVRQNMGFSLKLAKVDKAEIRSRVEEVGTALDLSEQLDRRPGKLSGGQRQRVAMGRAIIRNPRAFLMDEPLSNLDAKLRVQMRTELAKLQARLATTTVYVTHDQTEAMTLGNRVAVMNGGVLQQVATPRELYTSPANLFVAGFIGSPAMNLFEGELDSDAVHTPIGRIPLSARMRRVLERSTAASRRVVVGARPEDVVQVAESANGRVAHSFEVPVDLTESVGPDLYAHFTIAANGASAGKPSLVTEGDTGIARLDAETGVQRGDRLRLSVDPDRIHVFDAEDGRSLVTAESSEATPPAAALAPR